MCARCGSKLNYSINKMDWVSIITGIVGAIAGGGGVGLFFWRQNRTAKVIQNESALSSEWEKLYREQNTKREANDREIEELRQEVAELRSELEMLKAERRLICTDIVCDKRKSPSEIKKGQNND